MVAKKILLELLTKGLDAEEKAVPVYTKHLESALFWAGLKKETIEEGKATFERLAQESTVHKGIIKDLIEYIERSGADAF